ncbi:hypothetical protein F2Q68_00014181 [Brassica cretica]|uniref:Uncharacterized protein n=1 Tax=Brassica cretica TaxID=69181 RepID=A0A8S9HLQ9_BRACR|nr:hypothetical protein F2Q68_00014181 [Brassica cretica]
MIDRGTKIHQKGRNGANRPRSSRWLDLRDQDVVSTIKPAECQHKKEIDQGHSKTWLREREREREKEVRCFRSIDIFRRPINCREVPKDCPEEKEGSFRVMISPDEFIQDIEVGFWDLTSRYQDEDLEGIKGVPDFGDGFRARIAGPV